MEEDLSRAFTNPATKRSAWSLVLASEDQLDALAEQMPLEVLIRLALRELGDEGLEPFILPFLISASSQTQLCGEMVTQGVVERLFEHMDSHVPLKLSLLCNLSRQNSGQEKLLEGDGRYAARLASWIPREQCELTTQVLANLASLEAGRTFLASNAQKFLQFLSLFIDVTGIRGVQACKVLLTMLQSGQDFSTETCAAAIKRIKEVFHTRYPLSPSTLTPEQILSDKLVLPSDLGEPDEGLQQVIDLLTHLCHNADSLEQVQTLESDLCSLFQGLYLSGQAGCLGALRTLLEVVHCAIVVPS